MTKREFLQAVVTLVEMEEMADVTVMVDENEETTMVELKQHAEDELKKLDAALDRRKEKESAKQTENRFLMDKIYEILTNDPMTATVVGEMMELSTQKASALLRKMADEGRIEKTEVKIPKKGVQKGYMKRD